MPTCQLSAHLLCARCSSSGGGTYTSCGRRPQWGLNRARQRHFHRLRNPCCVQRRRSAYKILEVVSWHGGLQAWLYDICSCSTQILRRRPSEHKSESSCDVTCYRISSTASVSSTGCSHVYRNDSIRVINGTESSSLYSYGFNV